jgi:trehalose-6-phosphate synthase
MNLVAKEYVAVRAGRPGVLVLSEFAGAAEGLREAVMVNPYDVEAIRHRIEVAVTMSPEERLRRMRALEQRVATHTIQWWSTTFLDMLGSGAARLAMTA